MIERRRFAADSTVVEIDVFPNTLTLTAGSPTATVTAVARNRSGQVIPGVTIYFVSSDPSIATVDKNTGVVTRVASGTVTITGQLTDPGAGIVNRADNYNRADSAVSLGSPSDGGSAPTVRAGTVGISSNQAYCVAANSSGAGAAMASNWTLAAATYTCSANGTFIMDVPARSGLGVVGVMFRYVDDNNYWLFQILNNGVYVVKVKNGSATRVVNGVGTLGGGFDATTKLKVVMTASGFDCYTTTGGIDTLEHHSTDTDMNSGVEHGPAFSTTGSDRLDNLSWAGA